MLALLSGGFGLRLGRPVSLGKNCYLSAMTVTAHQIASGPGWRVADVICTAGASDRAFEEQHRGVCVALVTHGTFRYRTTAGTAVLSPGSLLLGNAGRCFECGHDHSQGDRCLAFHFEPALFEDVAAAVPGARTAAFDRAGLPALPALADITARAEAARECADGAAFEELAFEIAGRALAAVGDGDGRRRGPSARDEKRVGAAIRLIEAKIDRPLSLERLAARTATSPYHFLRSFRAVTGLTPYQYVLRTRLHRAAVRLKTSREPVSTIAYDAGFNDLATFNRRFRKVMGRTPGAYRGAA